MSFIEVFILLAIYSGHTAEVTTQPTLATCQTEQASFLKQVHPLKPGTACLKKRLYYLGHFTFKDVGVVK